jgi:hypothetical protein
LGWNEAKVPVDGNPGKMNDVMMVVDAFLVKRFFCHIVKILL